MTTAQAIVDEALSWQLTPYHKHGRVKGVGVDCSMLLAEVYERAGAIPHVDPEYAADWHLNHSEELYIQWLQRFGDEITEGEPQPGDAVVWRWGRTYSHGAIVVKWPVVLQAFIAQPVALADASRDEELRVRPRRVFRLRGVTP